MHKRPLPAHRICAAFRQLLLRATFRAFCRSKRGLRTLAQLHKQQDLMSKVKCKTALMTPAAVNEIMECGELALKQALRGELTHDCHTMLVTQHSIAQAIEKHGEVHGLVDLLAPAQPSLQAIYERSYHTGTGKWTPTALRASELAALKDLLAAHRFQLGNSTAMSIKAINQRVWSRSEPSKSKQRAVTIAGFLDGLRSKYGSTALHIDQLIAA